jgi:hypothetical protein
MPEGIKELYDKLHSSDLYTKTFEDFKVKYGSEQGMNNLYSTISKEQYFTGSVDDFKNKYYGHLKKKDNSKYPSGAGILSSDTNQPSIPEKDIPQQTLGEQLTNG